MKRKDYRDTPGRMKWKLDPDDCGRRPCPNEISVADAGYDLIEISVLEVARYFWQTFAAPQTHSWLFALQRAEQHFYQSRGDVIGLEVLATVQAMRMSRKSCFQFNNPQCERCCALVTENEQQFMNVFRAVRQNKIGRAKTHAMILCEGNRSDAFIERMGVLHSALLPERKRLQCVNTASVH